MTTGTASTLDAAIEQLRRGRPVIPSPPGEKGPRHLTKWQTLRLTEADVPTYFGNGENLGIILGDPSKLVDVDLDCVEALAVADRFLQHTGMSHGRAAKPRSHRWYVPSPIPATKQYRDINGTMLVELRSTGGQTIIPPSVHPSGEGFTWDAHGDPAPIDAATLQAAVARIASAAILARHWPAQGSRHDAANALAGFLLRGGWSEDNTITLIEAVITAAKDPEIRDRLASVRSTIKTLAAGRQATGGPRLAELLSDGRVVLERLRDWLGIRPPDDHGVDDDDDTDGASTDKKRPTQAEILVKLADQATLFHTPDGETGYAICEVDGHAETWPLRSKGFKRWLLQQFYKKEGKPPGAQAVADALGTLEARAHYDGSEYPVYVRLAEHRGNIYVDLADENWRVVEVTPDGWRVLENAPVRFRRPKGMLPLPVPERGGDLKVLRPFVNVNTEGDWQLYLGFCLAALRPAGPFPLLIQHGEQGTAKTTNSRVARMLLDPNISAVRAEPSDVRDIMVAAHNGWCMAFDNLSHLHDWLSDAFCRLATGGGFSTRELYTDQDEMIFEAQRPVILNGIEELATRGDLLDRSIILYLPRIEEKRRRPERGFWRDFEEAHPRLFGALLDVVSVGLRNLPDVHLQQHPRMADFARWIMACEPALGWETGSFLKVYASNRAAAHDLTLEASPITGPVRDLAERSGEAGWQGTSSDLLDLLNHPRPKDTKPPDGWPKSPRGLSNALRRLAPSLMATGVEIILPSEKTREARTRRRLLTIRKSRESCGPSVPTGPTNEETVTYAGTIGGTIGTESESFRPQGTERGPMGTQAELFRPPVSICNHKAGDDGTDGDDKIPSLSNGWEEV